MQSSSQKPTTLIELCEPFFIEVGEVLCASYEGVSSEPYPIRDRLKKRLDGMMEDSRGKYPWLERSYARIEPVLAVFADTVIQNSTLPFARLWQGPVMLAKEPRINIVNGKEWFFQELDATLDPHGRNPPPETAERLMIFQTCLGLGFGGQHQNNPRQLRDYSEQILQRLNLAATREPGEERICPTAYDSTYAGPPIFTPITEKLLGIGIVCGVVLLAAMVAYIAIYFDARHDIAKALGLLAGD
jgi:hypothetical protein